MKKILAIIMAICMLASVLNVASMTAFAAEETLPEPAAGTLLRVTAIKGDEVELVGDYGNFEDGWNAAMKLAGDDDEMDDNGYERIVVDIYTDWEANDDGQFSDDRINGKGFDNDTIYIPADAKVTLNLNGHTIDRGLTDDKDDGEVIFINDDADVIINNGTITGGNSNSEGGGLYIEGGANVTLNNVHIVGNTADRDDGGGIALYNGASLVMNGGSFRDNRLIGSITASHGGAVHVKDSVAVFTDVEFKNNLADSDSRHGVAVSAVDSTVTLRNCTFEGNGLEDSEQSSMAYLSIVYGRNSSIMAENCTFNNNRANSMIRLSSTYLAVNASVFNGITDTDFLIKSISASDVHVTGTTFSNNMAYAVSGSGMASDFISSSFFRNCTFRSTNGKTGTFALISRELDFYDCTFSGCKVDPYMRKYIKIKNSSVSRDEAVIGVSELREDGTAISVQYYKDFAAGWDFAMDGAATGLYGRVIVDFYADWNSQEYGVVTIPENARMTINLNGHKIDCDMGSTWNGEVMYISTSADVIINDGTITGGHSITGAGGIHINDKAKVVLNNVTLMENYAIEGSNGAAIAVYNGAVLVMNGGSLSKNYICSSIAFLFAYGTLYVNDATATLNNVTISNNKVGDVESEGAAIYADNSTVTLNDCVVSGNINVENDSYAESVIGAEDSTLIINNTDFTNNGKVSDTDDPDYCSLFDLVDCKLTMKGGKITDNRADKIFYLDDTEADISGVTVTGNASIILDVDNSSAKVTLTECTLGDNAPVKAEFDVIVDTAGTLILTNCDLGDTTFKDKTKVSGVGSIFGEGSLTMIIAFVALIASIASIIVNVPARKKKTVPVATEQAEDNK